VSTGTKTKEDTKSKKEVVAAAKTKRASRRAKRAGVTIEPKPESESDCEQPIDQGHDDQPINEASREGNDVTATGIFHKYEFVETTTKDLYPR
jgi:hypothetical protein